jgi:DNA repair protein RadC
MKKHYSKYHRFNYRTSRKLRLLFVLRFRHREMQKNILRQCWNNDLLELQEEFKIMLLNRYNKVIGIFTASQGGITGTVADPKLIFECALKAAASGNYPGT